MTITGLASNGDGWTPPVLKQYVDQRFLDSDKANVLALQAAEKAVAKAEAATEKRFDALSEEADRRASDLADKIAQLQVNMNQGQGVRQSADRLWAVLVPVIMGLIFVAVTLFVAFHK